MPNTNPALKITALLAAVSLFGFGCSPSSSTSTPGQQEVTGPKTAVFDNLSPEEATAKINFVPGSFLEVKQTMFQDGSDSLSRISGQSYDVTRDVVIARFAPRNLASVAWQVRGKIESDASIKARQDAERLHKPTPAPEFVDHLQQGSINNFDLNQSHIFMGPSFWPEKADADSYGTSGMWLSGEAYDELDHSRVASLDMGILSPNTREGVATAKDVTSALSALQGEEKKVENHIDMIKLDADKDLIDYPLTVNGKKVTVKAIRAHDWFGEIIVLNNKQNPLVLKMTLTPKTLLSTYLNYEVTAIGDIQQ